MTLQILKSSKKNSSYYSNRTGQLGFNLMLFFGLVDLCVGVFLTLTNSVATGLTIAGKFGPGGQPTQINGPWTIVVGIIIISLAIILKRVNRPQKDS